MIDVDKNSLLSKVKIYYKNEILKFWKDKFPKINT